MCGIVARFSVDGTLDAGSVAEVAAMTDALRHRGPDAGNVLDRSPLAVLGHRRLAIIDVAQGHQPMRSPDGELWVTYNGEIYNYRELKHELQSRGHRFHTSSDTEVLLVGYREWGEALPERLEGMFAFVLLDLPKRRLFLARDHIGKKPLYVRYRGGVLDAASELAPLRLASDWTGKLDETALAFYLRLGYIPAPWSVFSDVEKLRAGECWVVDAGGVRKRRYWDVPAPGQEIERSTDEAVDLLEAELRRAVRGRLMSEVPLGAFLSGGIDSSLVVALMAQELGPGVKTVTVRFAGEAGELEMARSVARRYRTEHHEHVVAATIEDLIPELQAHFGEPFADSSAVPTWHVAREARRRVTVALTGDGGDESFGGYDFRVGPHLRDARIRAALPSPARSSLALLSRVWPRDHRLPRFLRVANVLRNASIDEDHAFYLDLCFTSPSVADALVPDLARAGAHVEEHVRALYRSGQNGDPLQAIMRADTRFYLPEDVLVKVDRMSMAHGLEVRSPLLSRRIVELAFSIPSSLKREGGRSKALLRHLARRHLPSEVVDLPKTGFHSPLRRWLRSDLKGRLEHEILGNGNGDVIGLDRRAVRRLWLEYHEGRFDHSQTLWMLWMLGSWSRGLARGAAASGGQGRPSQMAGSPARAFVKRG
jgi:asparagine synthase (glutamine-hydrolysing)